MSGACRHGLALVVALAAHVPALAVAQDRGAATVPPIGVAGDWHPYVFSGDGVVLAPRTAMVEAGVGYNGVTGAGGGLQPDDARRVTGWISGTVGIVDRLQLGGTFVYGSPPATRPTPSSTRPSPAPS